MEELINYVRNQLAAKVPVQQIVSILQSRGFTDAQINEAFSAVMQPVQTPTTQAEPSVGKKMDATKVFVLIGTLLIVAAVIIVIASQWSTVGALARVSFLLIPMLLLFGISAFLAKFEQYKEYHYWTLAVSYLILPGVVGTALMQYKIIPEFNATFMATIFAIVLPVCLITEYLFKKYIVSFLTIAAFSGLIVALASSAELGNVASAWIYLVLALIILVAGILLTTRKMPNNKIYLVLGTLALLDAAPSAIANTFVSAESWNYEVKSLIYSMFGFLFLVLASYYNSLRSRLQEPVFYSLKRFIEEISAFVIVIPMLIIGFSETGYSVAALIFSLIIILLSLRIWINSFSYMGALGVVVSILAISSKVFLDSMSWPIIVFIAGFLILGFGLLIRKIFKIHKDNAQTLFLGLGKDPGAPKSNISAGKIVLWILLAAIAISAIWWGYASIRATRLLKQYNEESNIEEYTNEPASDPEISTQVIGDTSVTGNVVGYSYIPYLINSSSSENGQNFVQIKDENGEPQRYLIGSSCIFEYNGAEIANTDANTYFKKYHKIRLDYFNQPDVEPSAEKIVFLEN